MTEIVDQVPNEKNAREKSQGERAPRSILSELRRPFLSADTEFKVQALGSGKSALCVAYVDARHVQERLNSVCEEFGFVWSNEFKNPVIVDGEIKAVEAIIRINHSNGGFWQEHSDVGSLDNVNEKTHGLKALYSDAFKRAAVHFGIAVSLYGLDQMWLPKEDKYLKITQNNKAYMQKEGEVLLREQLVTYLKKPETIAKFGVPRA